MAERQEARPLVLRYRLRTCCIIMALVLLGKLSLAGIQEFLHDHIDNAKEGAGAAVEQSVWHQFVRASCRVCLAEEQVLVPLIFDLSGRQDACAADEDSDGSSSASSSSSSSSFASTYASIPSHEVQYVNDATSSGGDIQQKLIVRFFHF